MSSEKKRKSVHQKQKPAKFDKKQERLEQDKLICYQFAQCRNAAAVGREFGVNRMYVSRAWERLSDDEKEAILGVSEDVSEDLNKKIIKAEAMAADDFIANIIKARELAGKELLRRFTDNNVKMISDKDFGSLVKIVANITSAGCADDTPSANPADSTFRRYRESVQIDIEEKFNT